MNSLIELIALIKQRPVMYLGKNYLCCLKAYLDGWYFRDSDSVKDAYIMDLFQDWIMCKFELQNRNWADIITYYSQDESDALMNFFVLFYEFLKEKNILIN